MDWAPLNELRTFAVTQEAIALSARQRNFVKRYERRPCEECIIGLRLQSFDWGDDDRSSRYEFKLLLSPPVATELRIQRIDRNV